MLADRVSKYLGSIVERARQAEVAAAEAKVRMEDETRRATQERKARRLTLGLAISVLAGLCIAGGSYMWMESARNTRMRETAHAARAELREATRLQGRAEQADRESVSLLGEAVAAADRAAAIVAAGEVELDLRAEVGGILERLRRRHGVGNARAAESRFSRM